MPSIKNLFGFRKNNELDKSIIQTNPYRNNIDLEKRQFMKKGLMGLAGLGGLALASKIAKAGGLVFNDASIQTSAGGAEDLIAHGFEVSIEDNASSCTVGAGKLFHGSTKIDQTSDVTLTMGTAADWHDGVQDSYSGGAGWCYVGVNSSGDVKLLGDNPADVTDTSGNSAGKLIYWNNSSTYWFVVGAVRVDTADIADFQIHGYGREQLYRSANHGVLTGGTSTTFASVDLSAHVPAGAVMFTMQFQTDRTDSGNYESDLGDGTSEKTSYRFNPKESAANIRKATFLRYPIAVSQTTYYRSGAAAMKTDIYVNGWEW